MKDKYQERIEQEKLLQAGFVLQRIDCNRNIRRIEDRKYALEERKRELELEIAITKRNLSLVNESPAAKAFNNAEERRKSPTKLGLIARAIGYGISCAVANYKNMEAFGEERNQEDLMGIIGLRAFYIGGVSIIEGAARYQADATRIKNITASCTPDFLAEKLQRDEEELEKCTRFIGLADSKLRKQYTLRGQAEAGIDATNKNIANISAFRQKAIYKIFIEMFGEKVNTHYDTNEALGEIEAVTATQLSKATSQPRVSTKAEQLTAKVMEQIRNDVTSLGSVVESTEASKTDAKPKRKRTTKPKDGETAKPRATRAKKNKAVAKEDTPLEGQISFETLAQEALAVVASEAAPVVEKDATIKQSEVAPAAIASPFSEAAPEMAVAPAGYQGDQFDTMTLEIIKGGLQTADGSVKFVPGGLTDQEQEADQERDMTLQRAATR